MNEKIARAFYDELKKIGAAGLIYGAARAAAHVAPVALSLLGGKGPKPRKVPVTGGI